MPTRRVSLDELRSLVGQEVAVSDWIVLDQDKIDAFANLTGDRQWIHVDPDRVLRETNFGNTIAHGFLTLSMIGQLHFDSVVLDEPFDHAINYGLNRVRFPAPVPSGARIRTHSVLASLESQPAFEQMTWQVNVEVEGSAKPAVAAEWIVRWYRRK